MYQLLILVCTLYNEVSVAVISATSVALLYPLSSYCILYPSYFGEINDDDNDEYKIFLQKYMLLLTAQMVQQKFPFSYLTNNLIVAVFKIFNKT